MNSPEQPIFDEISLHLEIETVARELSTLEECIHEVSGPLAKKSFDRARMELLANPVDYVLRQVETARITWEHQPAIARYLYQEDDNN